MELSAWLAKRREIRYNDDSFKKEKTGGYMEKNEILMIYGKDFKRITRKVLEEADLKSRIPSRKSRIGIKPNLVSPSEASWGATTHPEVVAGIIEYLQESGFENLVMLEGSWVKLRMLLRNLMAWSRWVGETEKVSFSYSSTSSISYSGMDTAFTGQMATQCPQ